MNYQRGIELNLLPWYSRIPSADENIRKPSNIPLDAVQVVDSEVGWTFEADFSGLGDADLSFNLDPSIDWKDIDFEWGKAGGGQESTGGPTTMNTMKTPFDGGLDLNLQLNTDDIDYGLPTALAKIALVLSPVMTIPMIFIDPLVAWFDSQSMDAS